MIDEEEEESPALLLLLTLFVSQNLQADLIQARLCDSRSLIPKTPQVPANGSRDMIFLIKLVLAELIDESFCDVAVDVFTCQGKTEDGTRVNEEG